MERRNRTYYDGDLREDLLAAAVEVIGEVGPANLSLRDVARRVGVSHAAPKNHFAAKRALFTALAARAHEELAEGLRAAVAAAGENPLRRFAAGGRGYLDFARRRPALFAVMWREDLIDSRDPALAGASQVTFDLLLGLSSAVTPGTALAGADPVRVAVAAWALSHGLADLRAAGALDDLPGGGDPAGHDGEVLDVMTALLRDGRP